MQETVDDLFRRPMQGFGALWGIEQPQFLQGFPFYPDLAQRLPETILAEHPAFVADKIDAALLRQQFP